MTDKERTVVDSMKDMDKIAGLEEVIMNIQNIYEHLALKGGTAINMTIFDLPRLSGDLNLDDGIG